MSVVLDKFTQCSFFSIWSPRYHDKKVLLAARKVGTHNKIVFTGDPATGYNNMGEEPYYLSGTTIKKYKKETNGKIDCYAVPIDELQKLEINDKDWRELV